MLLEQGKQQGLCMFCLSFFSEKYHVCGLYNKVIIISQYRDKKLLLMC